MLVKKREHGMIAQESVRKNSVPEAATSKIVEPGKGILDVPVKDENRRSPNNHIEGLHEQVRREGVRGKTATRQKVIVRENNVCGRCKKSVSARDLTSTTATELYGSRICHECSIILTKQKDQVIKAKSKLRKPLASESVEPENVGTKEDTKNVVAIGVHKLPPNNRIERLHNQAGRFSEKTKASTLITRR